MIALKEGKVKITIADQSVSAVMRFAPNQPTWLNLGMLWMEWV
jgi:hypothetical protein